MTNRREMLQAVAITTLPAAVGAFRGAPAEQRSPHSEHPPEPPPAMPLRLHAVLVDQRPQELHGLGARVAARGVPVLALTTGDITQVWLDHIDPAWRRSPVAIAGLTARAALFCLEQLALERRLRVVFHAEHVLCADGRADHVVLRGGAAASITARDLMRAGPLWPERIVAALLRHPSTLGRARFGRSAAALEPLLAEGARLLSSWIIAPV